MSKVFLVDFDGTFYKKNSFKEWVKFLLLLPSDDGKKLEILYLKLNIVSFSICRAFRLISHQKWKKSTVFSWSKISSEIFKKNSVSSFNKYLQKDLNLDLFNFLCVSKEKGIKIFLTTAALDDYIEEFIKTIDLFDGYIATQKWKKLWVENQKYIKAKETKNLLDTAGYKNSDVTLFTDHKDDEPLIDFAQNVYLFPPASKNIKKYIEMYPDKIIKEFYNGKK